MSLATESINATENSLLSRSTECRTLFILVHKKQETRMQLPAQGQKKNERKIWSPIISQRCNRRVRLKIFHQELNDLNFRLRIKEARR
jgi:hypothetical protein